MNVNLQTCNSCFKSETLSRWSTKILLLCFLGFYRTPTDSTKEKEEEEEGSEGKSGSCQSCVCVSFSEEVKSTSKELRLKYDMRDLPGLEVGRVSWCGFLPSETGRLSTTLDTRNMGQSFRPRGPNEGHKQQGGGPERGAKADTLTLLLPGSACPTAGNEGKSERMF